MSSARLTKARYAPVNTCAVLQRLCKSGHYQEGALGSARVDSSSNYYASTRQLNIAKPSVELLMTSECVNIQ